ncbi:AGL337Cp [Eremothecium gossypii ATCC 10895]|uniref:AGL337Cp n=1 Tax=Eremothecium gossypii (strain ATCC 10895 / CBS 109.51 / FGSC 9923 / NRRL Y-1056) TaxID=284811 RepID=Q751N4_EREGS|nr:AGL337Cp [Eremothecium gossypii ATCC 10895]AAS54154.1 AGL337Cp [Eremothecium gossypii ATCC 10895]AEY98480.1 FAGL337Cp [Eremothecium gossypii FDAG1]
MWVKRYLLVVLYALLNHIPKTVWEVLQVVVDILAFWVRKFFVSLRPMSRTMYHNAIAELDRCTTFEEWIEKARVVDEITGADLWRRNFVSKRYDFNSVLNQYGIITEALDDEDLGLLMQKFSTVGPAMLRNFAGILDKRLFTKSLCGTKLLVELYLDKVLECLHFMSESRLVPLSFFQRCKLSLGTTALVLQGGSLFGLYHLGVIKGFLLQRLLPNIISGSSMGACIASLCTTMTNDELEEVFTGDRLLEMIKEDITLLKKCGYGNIDQNLSLGTLIQNVVHKSISKDVNLFIQYVKKNIVKDQTFEEAFQRTGKILNIVVHPTDRNVCPILLNYVTTPNVLISSAIDCSLGSDVASSDTKLLCKNLQNEIIDYLPSDKHVTFMAPQNVIATGLVASPYTRLTELFNVNNFIVSLARPYLAPLVMGDLKHEIRTSKYYYYKSYPRYDLGSLSPKNLFNLEDVEPLAFKLKYHIERKLKHILTLELRHRVDVLGNLGLLSHWIQKFAIDEKIPRSATEVTIVPKLKSLSISRVIEGQLDNIPYWIRCGEQSCWPVLSLVKTRCAVEYTLDDIIRQRRSSIMA